MGSAPMSVERKSTILTIRRKAQKKEMSRARTDTLLLVDISILLTD